MDITKPLRKGVFLALKIGEVKRWYWVKHERLSNFYYKYGRIGHGDRQCEEPIIEGQRNYEDWIRVNGDGRRLYSKSQEVDKRARWR